MLSVRQRDATSSRSPPTAAPASRDAVVVATGSTSRPFVPHPRVDPGRDVMQFTPTTYKRPAQLPQGTVLVVGASASGAQLARSCARVGKEVVLAGRPPHPVAAPLPRRRHLLTWLDRAGVFDDRASAVRDIDAARRQPSLSLFGSTRRRDLDLNTLQEQGVRVTGRLVAAARPVPHVCRRLADQRRRRGAKLNALLDRVDLVADAAGAPRTPRPEAVRVARARTTSTCAGAASRAWCGRRDSRRRTRGCTCRCSTSGARSASATASPSPRSVHPRLAVPAGPQVELHRRCRRRRGDPRARHRPAPPLCAAA